MAIPASQIVSVNPRLLQPGGTDLEFNGLFLTRNTTVSVDQMVLPFASAEDVGQWFGYDSEEHKAAVVYFAGYENSFKKPRAIYFGRRVTAPVAGWVRGASFGTLPDQTLKELKQIAEGTMTLSLGGSEDTITGIDFSEASSLSDVAQALQGKIRIAGSGAAWSAASVTYSSLLDAFTITAGETTADASIPTGTAATAMGFTSGAAVLSSHSEIMSATQTMDACVRKTSNFVTFTTVEIAEKEAAVELAQWASKQGVDYLYCGWDNDIANLTSGNMSTISAALTAANVSATCLAWNGLEYAAFIMGTAASIDYERRNGTITFAFKQQAALPANVTNGTDAQTLTAAHFNFVGNYATRNDQFVFMYPGQMYGSYRWIDTYLNAVWLNNALQVACMAGFAQTPRAPYNEEGYTLIRSWLIDPINRAKNSGIIDTGVTLSASQKSELTREAGRDISSELNTFGYVIEVRDPAPAVRQKRESPAVSVWYTYGGAVHRLDIGSTVVA